MVSIMCTMTMVLLLTLAWSVEGDNEQVVEERTVVVEIEDVNQPYNCSAFFDSLEVRLPRHWDFSVCSGRAGQRRTTYARPSQPTDILIGRTHPLFGTNPWSLQTEGCGKRGLVLNLPFAFLAESGGVPDPSHKGQILSREWTKYEEGIFPEQGFEGDRLYPPTYSAGNATKPNRGCSKTEDWMLCSTSEEYDRNSRTKQNLLCNGRSASEVMKEKNEERQQQQPVSTLDTDNGDEDEAVTNFVTINPLMRKDSRAGEGTMVTTSQLDAGPGVTGASNGPRVNNADDERAAKLNIVASKASGVKQQRNKRDVKPIEFVYSLSSTTKYHILLDQTSVMGEGTRWTNVKRALFRFINLLPVGSRLNIHAFGQSVKEVLPTTTVTELNRDGLFGRIPRRVLEETEPCVDCALEKALYQAGHNEVVVLISGVERKMNNHAGVLREVDEKKIPIYVISYPATIHTSYLQLASYGSVYAVVENSAGLRPLIHLQEILANIITKTESEIVEKIHETHYNSLGFAGTFTYEKEENADLLITLTVPDEEKVELFEVKDPSGKKRIFSKFEDGMVYFKFTGLLPPGIWSYHAKLYHDSLYPDTKMTVDVITKCQVDGGIIAEIFTSADYTIANVENEPVKVYAKIMKNGLPVLNAAATAELYMPGALDDGSKYALKLRDNGLGYPDITGGDGIYSAYVPSFSMVAGYYSVRLTVTDNSGQATVPKGQQVKGPAEGDECCGSIIDFRNETSPTGAFQRISTGPAFYVAKGFPLSRDICPPNRISDFELTVQEEQTLDLELAWTAPGGDYDFDRAHKYEIRCHTNRAMLSEANFGSKGILVHSDSLPTPADYGTNQSCTASVPWTNQLFYYAIVAFDDRDNRSPISNLVSVYIHEETTTTTTTTLPPTTSIDPFLLLKYLKNRELANDSFAGNAALKENFLKLSENLVQLELAQSNEEIYIAVGIVCGVVMMIVILLMSLVMISRRKRSVSPVTITTTSSSSTSPPASTSSHYDGASKMAKVSKVSPDGSSKVLLSWLESLPKNEGSVEEVPPSPPASHNHSMDSANGVNTISRRNQTLTRTNPYRHKMLTNGSFVSLKDIPTGSEEGSTRLTSSTVDDSTSSDTSSSSFNNIGLTSKSVKESNPASVKRSNTSAAGLGGHVPVVQQGKVEVSGGSLRRSHNTGFYSFRDYSPVYGTATLGRGGVFKSNLSVLNEDHLHGGTGRRTKRTESFV